MLTLRKSVLVGLAALVFGVSGCDSVGSGDYNTSYSLPQPCEKVMSVDHTTSVGYGSTSNWDLVSCDNKCEYVTYRIHIGDNTWYKTTFTKPECSSSNACGK